MLTCDAPTGSYRVHSPGPLTPRDWECLDGTLHVGDDGAPWLVFCHEWVQVCDGEVRAMRLSDDLSRPMGSARLLFRASEAPWTRPVSRRGAPPDERPAFFEVEERGGTLALTGRRSSPG